MVGRSGVDWSFALGVIMRVLACRFANVGEGTIFFSFLFYLSNAYSL